MWLKETEALRTKMYVFKARTWTTHGSATFAYNTMITHAFNRPHQAGETVWKHRIISMIRSIFHSNPSQKRSFSEVFLGKLENAGFSFSCRRKTFENRAFENDNTTIITWSVSWPSFFKHNSKMAADCYVFLRVDGKHLTGFQSKASNFLIHFRTMVD